MRVAVSKSSVSKNVITDKALLHFVYLLIIPLSFLVTEKTNAVTTHCVPFELFGTASQQCNANAGLGGCGLNSNPNLSCTPNCPPPGPYTFAIGYSEAIYCRMPSCPAGETTNPETGACEDPNVLVKLDKAKGKPENGVCPVGNPIHPATGNKFQIENFITSTASGLSFSRYYNSIDVDNTGNTIIQGRWSADYFQHLKIVFSSVKVVRPDQKVINYTCFAEGACLGDSDSRTILTKTVLGYSFVTKDDITEEFDTSGKLLSITPVSGEVQTLSYNTTTDLLETVTDHYGRTLNFTYDASERLETVTDPDGEVYTYTYDAAGNLTSVIYPDDTPTTTADNSTRQYQYNDPNFDSLLTAIIDENGNTYANFGYDTQGRAILSEHSNGTERVDLVYNVDGTTTVTDSLGASNTFTFETIAFSPKTIAISGGQCGSGCSNQGQAQTYDANGFLASRTDFEGNVTTFINNARGLQESRTEAVGTPEERIITTEWHPDYRLPTKITEPGKETVFTYDTQGRLLSRTEREI